jgi:hypothetical protein
MNISILLIGTLLLALFFLPFILAGIGKNKEQLRLSRALKKKAAEDGCSISQIEHWTDSAIGLAEGTSDLFFVHRHNGNEIVQHIKLDDIRYCRVRKFERQTRDKSRTYSTIDKIELDLKLFDKARPEICLEFFHAEGLNYLNNELLLAEKWAKIVNAKLVHH